MAMVMCPGPLRTCGSPTAPAWRPALTLTWPPMLHGTANAVRVPESSWIALPSSIQSFQYIVWTPAPSRIANEVWSDTVWLVPGIVALRYEAVHMIDGDSSVYSPVVTVVGPEPLASVAYDSPTDQVQLP